MKTTQRIAASIACIVVLGGGVSACASQDKSSSSSGSTSSTSSTSPTSTMATMATTTPAVCADVTALRASADKIKGIQIGEGGLATLSTELAVIQSTLKEMPADASAQYSTEIDAIQTARDTLEASIKAAQQSPSVATLAAVAADVQAVGTSIRGLTEAVGGNC